MENDASVNRVESILAKKELFDPAFNHWMTYEEVNEFSTEEIIKKLRKLGIPFDTEKFLQDVETYYSAEDVSENWFSQYDVQAAGRVEDFPWFAAWVLWDRLAPPENLSEEQLSDRIENGYDALKDNDPVTACDEWLHMWEDIQYRIQTQYKTLNYLDEQYRGSFFVRNVVQDLELTLDAAGQKDPTYYEKRIAFCQSFCRYFPGEELIYHNMRRAIAEAYYKLGQLNQAEKEFEQLIAEVPVSTSACTFKKHPDGDEEAVKDRLASLAKEQINERDMCTSIGIYIYRGGNHMLIQCTKALLDKMGVQASELEYATVEEVLPKNLTSWHAHFVSIDRRKAIVLMNNETRYPVVIYRPVAKDFKQIKSLMKEAIKEALRMEGFSAQVIDQYMELSGDIVYSKTANRSMVAQLNNAIRDVEAKGDYLDESTNVQRFISNMAGRQIQQFFHEDYFYPIEKMVAKLEEFATFQGIQENIIDVSLYQLHIQIVLEGHDIWRKVLVPSTYSFRHLHNIIQTVFDWHNSHLHEFIMEEVGPKPLLILMDDSPEMMDFINMEKFTVAQERFTALEDVLQVGFTLDYMYDFGDGWRHRITVEKILKSDALQATYIDGQGQRPPEDVGGQPGFEEYLTVMNDSNHPDYDFMNTWAEDQKERLRSREEMNRRLEGVIEGYWFSPYL